MRNLRLKKLSQLDEESGEQCTFVEEVQLRYPWIKIGCIPNGEYRPWVTAKKIKKMGGSAGIPDLILIIDIHTVWVEMKKKKGGVISAAQREWAAHLVRSGHHVLFANGCDEAISKLEQFIKENVMRKIYCDMCGKSDADIDIEEWHVISTKQKYTKFKKDICAMCADKMLEQFEFESK